MKLTKKETEYVRSKVIGQLTPSEIVEELDKYIIGQDNAKKSVAIALRNRWRRQNVIGIMREEIMPNNIIMIGPTGVGKTEIARRISRLANAPFIKVEASKFTEVGYVGRDVESMIRELTDLSVTIVKNDKQKEVQPKAEESANERILDIMLPPVKKRNGNQASPAQADSAQTDSAEDSAQASKDNMEQDTYEVTRSKLRKQLKDGKLDDRNIELDITTDSMPMLQVLGPIGLEEMGLNLQDLFGNIMPKKSRKRKLTIAEAKTVLTHEESQKLIDMDNVIKEAIDKVQNSGIVFIDEIDKITGSNSKNSSGADVSREGVQRDLLPIVEGSSVITKYGSVKTDHILFIASGAFHSSKPSDLIPELQGRFPIRVELNSLNEEDFYKILTQPENALIKQYKALMETEKVELIFKDNSIREVARIAAEVNEQVENIGARRLHTILTTLLEDILFEVPDKNKKTKLEIDKALVNEKLNKIVKNRDLSRYIL
ncbi:MAG: ATP-dependent protease ATPase subunit HslU [Ignavibacteriae bacterium]|jgi:ATP-dependent HslUV protease ATP-binding subunit HslU|nr:ATP-dependent protease ATPase subunit HslU [Ignavibacteriota bacterium]